MNSKTPVQVFFSDHYHIELPADHPFPMLKYRGTRDRLLETGVVSNENLQDPGLAERGEILTVHTRSYWEKIRLGTLSKEELRKLGFPWSRALFTRSRAAVAGTISATRAALQDGLSINLAGGTHHSFPDRASGYCVFNDVAIATRLHCSDLKNPLKVMIVDLDAHQGNGNHFILAEEERVYTLSAHVGSNFPREKYPGTEDIEFPRGVKGREYMEKVSKRLSFAVDLFNPDLAIYIAGVDVHEDDRFGQMSLTSSELADRDRYTIKLFLERKTPVAIVLGGGYNRNKDMTTQLHCQTVEIAIELLQNYSMPLRGS